MDIVLLGALIATFLITVSTFVVALGHGARIDRERHMKYKG
jgi:hypothetical protein